MTENFQIVPIPNNQERNQTGSLKKILIDTEKNGFDLELFAQTNPYIIRENVYKYFPIANFCAMILEKRLEIEEIILKTVPPKKTDWFIQSSNSKFIDILFEGLQLKIKSSANEVFLHNQKNEFMLFDSVKQIYIQQNAIFQKIEKASSQKNLNYQGLFIFEEYTSILTSSMNQLYDILIFYHVNKIFIDYALTKMDANFSGLQRPQKASFLEIEFQDPESYIFKVFSNGNCFRLLAILNSVIKLIKELFEKISFHKHTIKENTLTEEDQDADYENTDEFGVVEHDFEDEQLCSYVDEFKNYINVNINKSLNFSVVQLMDYYHEFEAVYCLKNNILMGNTDLLSIQTKVQKVEGMIRTKYDKEIMETAKTINTQFKKKIAVQQNANNLVSVVKAPHASSVKLSGFALEHQNSYEEDPLSQQNQKRESGDYDDNIKKKSSINVNSPEKLSLGSRKQSSFVDLVKANINQNTPIEMKTALRQHSQLRGYSGINLVQDLENAELKAPDEPPVCYSMLDLFFVLLQTFVYMFYYYASIPGSKDQSEALGMEASITGVVNACTPIGAGLSCFQYNSISKKSYYKGYIQSYTCLNLGIALMALSQTFDSAIVLSLGRICFGYGGARAILRKFISLNVYVKYRNTWMAIMVGVTSTAVTLGPGFNSIFQNIPTGKLGPFEIESYNISAFICLPITIITAIVHLCLFKDTGIKDYNKGLAEKKRIDEIKTPDPNQKLIEQHKMTEYDIKKIPSGLNFSSNNQEKITTEIPKATQESTRNNFIKTYKGLFYICDENLTESVISEEQKYMFKETSYSTMKRYESYELAVSGLGNKRYIKTVYNDSMTYYFTFFFLLIKVSQEAYINEFPLTVSDYYDWNSTKVGYIWQITTVVSLPASQLVAFLSGKWTDKKILWTSSIFYFITLLMKINYQYDKKLNDVWYLISSTIFFCATLVSESIVTSLQSKVISKKKALSFWNAGLMSGLADTFGRAIGSSLNTVFAKLTSVSAVPCLMYSFYSGVCFVFLIIMFLQWPRMEVCYYYQIVTSHDESILYEKAKIANQDNSQKEN